MIGLGVWLFCCLCATAVLTLYSHTPNDAGAAQVVLTDTNAVQLDENRPTLVMYVHPRCPCTLASVEGLARLQRKFVGRFALRVVFSVPQGMETDWHETSLWESVGRISDCERILDKGGRITRQAGAETSGTVGVYEPDGRLMFWGGVTASRGHAGDSPGTDAIAGYFNNLTYQDRTNVYGCPINGPYDAACDIETSVHCQGSNG